MMAAAGRRSAPAPALAQLLHRIPGLARHEGLLLAGIGPVAAANFPHIDRVAEDRVDLRMAEQAAAMHAPAFERLALRAQARFRQLAAQRGRVAQLKEPAKQVADDLGFALEHDQPLFDQPVAERWHSFVPHTMALACLTEMVQLWRKEAERNNVFPIISNKMGSTRSQTSAPRRRTYEFWGKDISISAHPDGLGAPTSLAGSFTLKSELQRDGAQANGVVAAVGSREAGWSLYFDRGQPVFAYARSSLLGDFTKIAVAGL